MGSAGEALSVGTHEATLTFAWTDPGNGNPVVDGRADDRAEGGGSDRGCAGGRPVGAGPADPQYQDYTLTNHHVDTAITVLISTDVDWLDVDVDGPTLLAGEESVVRVSVNANADQLLPGMHAATVTFADTFTGEDVTRAVELTVGTGGTLSVVPFDDFAAAGQVDGPVRPSSKLYTLTNVAGGGDLDWSVVVESAEPPDVGWLTINEGPVGSAGGALGDGESLGALIAIAAAGYGVGDYTATLRFEDGSGDPPRRTVTLTIVDPQFDMQERPVTRTVEQPLGPTHSFFMGTFHTTNAEFAAFLNDARADAMGASPGARSDYMFFDETTGDVCCFVYVLCGGCQRQSDGGVGRGSREPVDAGVCAGDVGRDLIRRERIRGGGGQGTCIGDGRDVVRGCEVLQLADDRPGLPAGGALLRGGGGRQP